jgi:hypothetical protein
MTVLSAEQFSQFREACKNCSSETDMDTEVTENNAESSESDYETSDSDSETSESENDTL